MYEKVTIEYTAVDFHFDETKSPTSPDVYYIFYRQTVLDKDKDIQAWIILFLSD